MNIDKRLEMFQNSIQNLDRKFQSFEQMLKQEHCDTIDKSNNNRMDDDDEQKIQQMFSIKEMINEAQLEQTKPYVWFASNETKIPLMTLVAKHILQKQNFPSCQHENIPHEFDSYRNCFRSLSIEFHNRISLLFDQHHWFTLVGRIQYAFMITTIQSRRNEYLFQIGNIYFQIIEYDHLLTMPFDEISDDVDVSNTTMINDNNDGEQKK
ncbi:hypothetical protein DERF_013804 [Dermatophagoides farinae]|uniref:Uncharacterized protein n=1 Tax=Dermatophagoides farinae TaxID=6954 RepID=A0A922KX11_DERFA|nr:hypothetical protein DERF_013804 [Dermatophagoides farinae]